MEKITIKELVDFRRTKDKSRKAFAQKLKNRKAKEVIKEDDGKGGDYWITSTSCLKNVFKSGDTQLYDLKIEDLYQRHQIANVGHKKTLERNIDILNNFKDFDFSDLKPNIDLKFPTVSNDLKTINIDGFPIYTNPSIVFSYEQNGKEKIGAIIFIAQLEGFKKSELGMFCEMLYRFLIKNFDAEYQISEEYCSAIDVCNAQKVSYTDLIKGDIPFLTDNTLQEIKEL